MSRRARAPREPRVVLGVVDGLHDAGAALVVDGRIVAAANEERFTRVKLQGGMPTRSIEAVLRTARVPPSEVDLVAVGGLATPTLATRMFRPLQSLYGPSMGICFDRPWHPVDRLGDLVRYRLRLTRSRPGHGAGLLESALAPTVIRRALPGPLRGAHVTFVDHHLAHAESAWRTSGPGTWLVVTADAHGDGRSLTVHTAREGESGLSLLHEVGVEASLGAFYSYVTRALGFRPGRHEGKVLGLSARGDAARVPMAFPFRWVGEALRYDGEWGLRGMRRLDALRALAREDVAAWVQRGAEEILLSGIRRWLAATDARQVALAGGVFANVLVNGKVAALPGVEIVHVFPHMGDGGLAAGAALHAAARPPEPLGTACLGPAPTEEEHENAAQGSGLPFTRPADPDRDLVDALARGLPAARCVGAMEFGPRALGHRSILAPAHVPGMGEALNRALVRDDFMPFAPLLCAEDAPECFEGFGPAAGASRYMTVALPAKARFRETCPGAVHVDGTARPQTVVKEEDPDLHRLVAEHAARTGRPAMVNTSFNMHEEPIVNTPRDAVRAFLASGLPLLRLGPFLLSNPSSPFVSGGGG